MALVPDLARGPFFKEGHMSDTEVLNPATPQETAAPEGPFSQTAQPPQPEAVPAETAQEVASDKWWPGVESEDDILAHERIAPRLEEREQQGYSRGVLDGKVSALEVLDARSNTVTQAQNVASAIIGRLNKAARDGNLDSDAIDNLLTDHTQSLTALNRIIGDELRDEGRVEGYREFVRSVAGHLSDTQLETEFTNRIALALRGVKDDRLVSDFVTRITQKAEKSAHDKGFEEGKKAGEKAVTERVKAESRAGEGPHTAPGTGGSSSITRAEDLDKISTAEWLAMPQEQRDRLLQEAKRVSR